VAKKPARAPRPPAKSGETQRLTVDIDQDLHYRLKLAALQNRQAIADLVREGVALVLARYEQAA
jgi:hypothetical protein